MKDIRVDSMHIERFKGIANLDVRFGVTTVISGRNGSGKTCVYDAYLWCLFNKDSRGRLIDKVQFMQNGVADKDARTVVSILFKVDGQDIEFRRELYQSWRKKRGTTESIYEGDASDYFYNNVPLTLTEYNDKLKALFDKDKFELVSNINMFASLDTKTRRNILEEIADVASLTKLIASEFPVVEDAMMQGKSVDEYTEELRKRVARVNGSAEQIPVRIDEIKRSIPAELPDFDALRKKKEELQGEIEKHEKDIQRYRELAVSGSNTELRKKLDDINSEMSSIVRTESSEYNKQKNAEEDAQSESRLALSRAKKKLSDASSDLDSSVARVKTTQKQFDDIKESWTKENERTYVAEPLVSCPTCGHVFTAEELAEKEDIAISMFNRDKLDRLGRLEKDAANIKLELDRRIGECKSAQESYDLAEKEASKAQEELDAILARPSSVVPIDARLKANARYTELIGQRDKIQAEIDTNKPHDYSPEIDAEKKAQRDIALQVGAINVELAKEQQNANAQARLAELEQESRDLGQEKADLEQKLDQIQAFQSRKMTAIEDRINGLFQYVKIQMFKPNKTNDGVADACEIVVNDIPFSVLNTASRINAGIDICCTLATAYDMRTPIWVDNAESVNKFIWSDCQLITLRVSEEETLSITL